MSKLEKDRTKIENLLSEFIGDGKPQLKNIIFDEYYTKVILDTNLGIQLVFVESPADFLYFFIVPGNRQFTGSSINEVEISDLFEVLGLDPGVLPKPMESRLNDMPLVMRHIQNNWILIERSLNYENKLNTLKKIFDIKQKRNKQQLRQ